LALAKLDLPRLERVTLTDFVPAIVKNIAKSAGLNRTPQGGPLPVRAALCDWAAECERTGLHSAHGWPGSDDAGEGLPPILASGLRFDLCVCADVLYEEDHPELVAGVVRKRLRPGGRFVMHASIRSCAILTSFLAHLQKICSEVRTMPAEQLDDDDEIVQTPTMQDASAYEGGIVVVTAIRNALPDSHDATSHDVATLGTCSS